MSGKPNQKDVDDLVYLVGRLTETEPKLDTARRELARLKLEEEQLSALHGDLVADIQKRMGAMDVRSPGNSGWESRMVPFLSMFHAMLKRRLDR